MNPLAETASLKGRDGTRLCLARWPVEGEAEAVLLVLHGYFEHGGRYEEFARTLSARQIAVLALDLRGHGHSEGFRGHVLDFEEYLDDVDVVMEAMALDGRPLFLLGHSLGGLVAFIWASTRPAAHGLRGLILTNPYLERALVVPAWKIAAARFMARIKPTFSLPSGLDSALLSHDAAKNNEYRRDPLIFNHATAGWFVAVTRAQKQAARAAVLCVPLLCVIGGADAIARPQATRTMFERVRAPDKTLKELPGQYHEVLNEVRRADLYEEIASWVLRWAKPTQL